MQVGFFTPYSSKCLLKLNPTAAWHSGARSLLGCCSRVGDHHLKSPVQSPFSSTQWEKGASTALHWPCLWGVEILGCSGSCKVQSPRYRITPPVSIPFSSNMAFSPYSFKFPYVNQASRFLFGKMSFELSYVGSVSVLYLAECLLKLNHIATWRRARTHFQSISHPI